MDASFQLIDEIAVTSTNFGIITEVLTAPFSNSLQLPECLL